MNVIEVQLRGPLARYGDKRGDGGRMEMAVDNGVTVQEILNRLGIPRRHVGLVVVNGRKGSGKSPLGNGDRIILFPVVAGG